MFRTSNPAWRNEAFQPAQTWDDLDRQGRSHTVPGASAESEAVESARAAQRERSGTMSVQGVVNKTSFLLFLCVCTALVSWNVTTSAEPVVNPMLLTFGGAIAGLITALVCCFAPKTAPVTAPIYALFQGLFVGGISAVYAIRFAEQSASDGAVQLNTGLIFNAALLTFGILGGMLLGYKTGLIRSGPVFRRVVVTATLGALLYAVVAMVAAMFGSFSLASVYDPSNGGLISIGFSVLLVGIASANLILDFDMVEVGVKNGAPRSMEWYAGFGLLVTLIWLYLEVLRLLAKLRRE